jgi:ferrochelatase
MSGTRGILLMAYGSPDGPEQIEPYYTHIRGGRTPSPQAIAHLVSRYERVGGRTPLLELTRSVQHQLASTLATSDDDPPRVYIGMKHWHPFIADTVRAMVDDGVREVLAIALAPHYSRMSIGGYRQAAEAANHSLGDPLSVRFVDRWHDAPEFVALISSLVRDAVASFGAPAGALIASVFTAHSLPVRIREWNDSYERELADSAAVVSRAAGLATWRVGWQSAGATAEPWIGPDVLDILDELSAEGASRVLIVPIGFVCEHLEILYDLDVEAKERAATLGLELRRTQMPNDSEAFVRVLAAVAARGWAQPAAVPA